MKSNYTKSKIKIQEIPKKCSVHSKNLQINKKCGFFSKIQNFCKIYTKIFSYLTLKEYCTCLLLNSGFSKIIIDEGIPKFSKKVIKEINDKKYSLKQLITNDAKIIQRIVTKNIIPHNISILIFSYIIYQKLQAKYDTDNEYIWLRQRDNKYNKRSSIELNLDGYQIGNIGMEYIVYMISFYSDFYLINLSNNNLCNNNAFFYKKFTKSLQYCTIIREINLSNNKITDVTVTILFESLIKAKSQINKIVLGSNEISFESCQIISKFLSLSKYINFFDISKNIIGERGLGIITEGLSRNTTLSGLDVSFNGITSNGCKYFIQILSSHSCPLKYLNLSGNYIQCTGFRYLSQAIAKSSTLSHLDLAYNNDDKDNKANINSYKELSIGIGNNTSITVINISGNKLYTIGIEHLFNALSTGNFLKELILADSNFSSELITALVLQINKIKSLKRLDFSRNTFDSKAAGYLFYLFKDNTSLEEIDMSGCRLGEGISYIGEGVKSNKTLKTLKLSKNRIKSEFLENFNKNIYFNTSLTTLFLDNNMIDDKGAESIAHLLIGGVGSINHWDLSFNFLSNKGGNYLLESIKLAKHVKSMIIENNNIGKDLMNSIQTIINKSL